MKQKFEVTLLFGTDNEMNVEDVQELFAEQLNEMPFAEEGDSIAVVGIKELK